MQAPLVSIDNGLSGTVQTIIIGIEYKKINYQNNFVVIGPSKGSVSYFKVAYESTKKLPEKRRLVETSEGSAGLA